MKKILFVLLCLVVSSTQIKADVEGFRTVSSEEDLEYINTNIDEDGKRDRGSYLTNPWYSNWAVGIMGGAQTFVSGAKDGSSGFDAGTAIITPSLELDLTKWFTPVFGIRGGFQGFWAEDNYGIPGDLYRYGHYIPKSDENDPDHIYYHETYIHGDVMWNVINSFCGYRANRFYNAIPYAEVGYLRLVHPDDGLFSTERRDREFGFGFGLLNTFRINKRFQALLDLRWNNIAGRYHDVREGTRVHHFTVSAGVAYNIEKWYFARVKGVEEQRDVAKTEAVAAMVALNEVVAANEELKNQLGDASDKIDELEELVEAVEVDKDDFESRAKKAEHIAYYEINISKLNVAESRRMDEYVSKTLESDPNHVFYLTGSADRGTGTYKINTRLSSERANGVRDLLIKKYGLSEEQVVIKAMVISSEHLDGGLDRCVIFENE